MLIDHLRKTFADRCRNNPRYSLRAFARSLNIDSSTLSALLRRSRPLTPKTAKRLIDSLEITDSALAQSLLMGAMGDLEIKEGPAYHELDMTAAEVLSSWEHFAILAYLEVPQSNQLSADSKLISRRLDIPLGIVNDGLERLRKMGLLSQQENGRWVLTGRNFSTPTDIPRTALRKPLRQTIEKSLESLANDPVELRDISGITMAIDRDKLPEAKKMILEFRRKLSEFLEDGKKNSVYRLNIQLYPLTKEESP